MKKIMIIALLLSACTKDTPDYRRIPDGSTVYVNWKYWRSMKNVDIQGPWIIDSLSKESFSTFYSENFYFIHNTEGFHELMEDRALQMTPSHETPLDKLIH